MNTRAKPWQFNRFKQIHHPPWSVSLPQVYVNYRARREEISASITAEMATGDAWDVKTAAVPLLGGRLEDRLGRLWALFVVILLDILASLNVYGTPTPKPSAFSWIQLVELYGAWTQSREPRCEQPTSRVFLFWQGRASVEFCFSRKIQWIPAWTSITFGMAASLKGLKGLPMPTLTWSVTRYDLWPCPESGIQQLCHVVSLSIRVYESITNTLSHTYIYIYMLLLWLSLPCFLGVESKITVFRHSSHGIGPLLSWRSNVASHHCGRNG